MSDDSNDATGFDDSELEDIMSEIESLENDFDNDDAVTEAALEAEAESEVDSVVEPESEVEAEPEATEESEPEAETEAESEPESEEIVDPVLDDDGDDTLSEIENAIEESDREEEELKAKGEELFPDVDKSSLAVNSFEEKKTDLQMVIEEEMSQASVSDNVVSSKSTVPHSEMSFSVEGDMTLKLNFKVGGEHISLHIEEDTGFVIELSSGAKFTVPIESSLKKAS